MNKEKWLEYFDLYVEEVHSVFTFCGEEELWNRVISIREKDNYDQMWEQMNILWTPIQDNWINTEFIPKGYDRYRILMMCIERNLV